MHTADSRADWPSVLFDSTVMLLLQNGLLLVMGLDEEGGESENEVINPKLYYKREILCLEPKNVSF